MYATTTDDLQHAQGPRRTHYVETATDGRTYTLCVTIASIEILGRDDPRSPWYASVTCGYCDRERSFREALAEAHRRELPHLAHDGCPGKQLEGLTWPEREAGGCPICGLVTWARWTQVPYRREYEYQLGAHYDAHGNSCLGWRVRALHIWKDHGQTREGVTHGTNDQ